MAGFRLNDAVCRASDRYEEGAPHANHLLFSCLLGADFDGRMGHWGRSHRAVWPNAARALLRATVRNLCLDDNGWLFLTSRIARRPWSVVRGCREASAPDLCTGNAEG